MRIANLYSHFNGHEHIRVHKPAIWGEIEDVIAGVDATACRTLLSKEKAKLGATLYSPPALNRCFADRFRALGWRPARTSYCVTANADVMQATIELSAEEQRRRIIDAGLEPIFSYKEIDFLKERVAVEVQMADYAAVAYEIFVKQLAFHVAGQIDVAVEVLPVKELQAQMPSGIPYYEAELYNVLKGRPAVPLVLVGVAA